MALYIMLLMQANPLLAFVMDLPASKALADTRP
jgi:hypothetical protein